MTYKIPVFAATLVACTPVLAQNLPYNPTYLIQGQDSTVYQLTSGGSPQFAAYNVTNGLKSTDTSAPITSSLPFLNDSSTPYIPLVTRNGLTVFSGDCSEGEQELNLWSYGFGAKNQTWTQMQTTSSDSDLSANYLAAGFAFPSTALQNEDSLYVFGGMCPNGTNSASTSQANAAYSNMMLTISPEQKQDYQVSLTGTRAPPIAEAGLSITPLVSTSLTSNNVTTQQNFVLIGGHTQTAFINMSQVALFSMPEQAWAFVGINQPAGDTVEPRSGHSAAITADGSRIVVFGGWVGSLTNAASPQLAVLEIGQGYGGNGSWAWTVPTVKSAYLGGASGVYGHGAVMLPGDIMMVSGGYSITGLGSKKSKRTTVETMFYNVSAASWSQSYINPLTTEHTEASHSGLTETQKTGLGAGLGIGIAVLIVITVLAIIYIRRKRVAQKERERQLRAMALGNGQSTTEVFRQNSQNSFLDGFRSASWGARQEQQIEGNGFDAYSYERGWQNSRRPGDVAGQPNVPHVSGPPSSLKNSLRARGQPGFGNNHLQPPNGVFTIEEVEERSERGSLQRPRSAASRPHSDPFKDPPQFDQRTDGAWTDPSAEKRKKEVERWVEDWESAAGSMNISRTPSKATTHNRTYSNLSAFQSSSSSSGKDVSNRTNSNVSERSDYSHLSRAAPGSGSISRSMSQRSQSAGYALFSSAAAAVGRLAGRQDHATIGIERSPSKRAVSTGDLSQLAAQKRGNPGELNNPLTKPQSRDDLNAAGEYFTPLESPIKDYKNHSRKRSSSLTSYGHSNSLTSQSRKALGALSQGARRILTGTGSVSVPNRVNSIEHRSQDNSPTKTYSEMHESSSRQVSNSGTSFWKHRQGARDWDDSADLGESSGTIRRRSGRPTRFDEREDDQRRDKDNEDWDIETAVQQRVVQVMFTVPKEKLRVVNADSLSMLSRSNTDASRRSTRSDDARDKDKDKEVNRMSKVTEANEVGDDVDVGEDTTVVGSSLHPDSALTYGKGKDRAYESSILSHRSGETIGKVV